MKTSDFYYDLPKELIAQDPLEDRSSSRLLHLSMKDGSMEHRHFTDILDYKGYPCPSLRTQRRNRCTDRDPALETP